MGYLYACVSNTGKISQRLLSRMNKLLLDWALWDRIVASTEFCKNSLKIGIFPGISGKSVLEIFETTT